MIVVGFQIKVRYGAGGVVRATATAELLDGLGKGHQSEARFREGTDLQAVLAEVTADAAKAPVLARQEAPPTG